MSDFWPRPCRVCGVPYDGRLRGVEGRFHMEITLVEEGDPVVLVGHWREGILPQDGNYTLRSRDREEPFTAEVLPAPSEVAAQRGQLRLRVVSGLIGTAGVGCVWGSG